MLTLQTIDIGAAPNDGTGDTLRDAFNKCNLNFTAIESLDAAPTLSGNLDVDGNSIISTAAGDITLAPDTTGSIILDELKVNATVISANTPGSSISLTTSGVGVTNINAVNITGGLVDGATVGTSNPQQGKFLNLFSDNHRPNSDGVSSSGTASYRWSEVNTLLLTGSKVVLASPGLLNASGAISLLKSHVKLDSSGGAIAATLADGADGHLMVITMTVAGSNAVVTPSNAAGFVTLTFNSVGDTATLIFSDSDWMLLSSYGVTIA